MKEIVFASNNKGKIREVQEILRDYKILSLEEIGIDIDVEEDKDTFEGNAIKKAVEISKYLNGKMVIADDSGIEIEYLDGFPGVFTKRWNSGTDRDRNLSIIKKLYGIGKQDRKITMVTAIALAQNEKVITTKGTVDGYVVEEPRGENGFGFDEIFELENGRTLAELSADEKNKISARKRALEALKEKLNERER